MASSEGSLGFSLAAFEASAPALSLEEYFETESLEAAPGGC